MNKVSSGQSSRETALIIMYNVAQKGAYANLELHKVLGKSELPPQDRGLVTELVYGTIRMQGTLDYILSRLVKRSLDSLPPWILLILRQGAYQLLYLEHIPGRAAVNESVNLAKKYGHAGTVKFVNGVLRNLSRTKEDLSFPALDKDPVAHISVVYSHPRWLVERWMKQFGVEQCLRLCAADNKAPHVTVRTNTLRISRDRLMERLAGEGVTCRPGVFAPESIILEGVSSVAFLPSFQEGLFQVQDESSMLVAHILDPQPGSNVVDSCAAPGGKATHAAQIMQNRGIIKAFDLYPHKVGLIQENSRRLGLNIVNACAGDAGDLPEELSQWADYCLVDAPCSGLGVLGRRPDSRWNKSEQQIKELTGIQRQILASSAQTVKPGGVLVYSTCTITPEENQGMVQWFLEHFPTFYLDPVKPFIPFRLKEQDLAQAEQGMVQLLPHVHGTDGLFIARMKRKERDI